jgi:protein-tyrosine phosphatase
VIASRDLVWDGCLNVRELGGHPTEDGGETRVGSVVRADSVRQLSDAGWQALVDYGIRTVVDLRGHHEREEDPPQRFAVDVVHVPLMDSHADEARDLGAEIDEIHRRNPDAAVRTREIYVLFLDRFRDKVGAAVRAVGVAPPGGVVIHCVGGKDRTGLLTSLLLHLAGVPTDVIAADYALTEERLRPREEAWLAAAETDEEREEIRRLSRTPPAVIVGVFEELQRRYGSVEGYLHAAGLEEEDLERARARLR